MFCGYVYIPWYLTNSSLRGRGHWTLVCVYSFNESDSEVIIITQKKSGGTSDHPDNRSWSWSSSKECRRCHPDQRRHLPPLPRLDKRKVSSVHLSKGTFQLPGQPPASRSEVPPGGELPLSIWMGNCSHCETSYIWLKMKRSEISLPWKANEGVQGQDRSKEFISEANLIVVGNVKHCKVIHVSKKNTKKT